MNGSAWKKGKIRLGRYQSRFKGLRLGSFRAIPFATNG